jgi:hypothetical protein
MNQPPENPSERQWRVGLAAYLIAVICLSGCDDGSDLSGQLLLEGQPIPGELVFEPLDEKKKLAGQSVTVYADETGNFQTLLPEAGNAAQLRIVIRATPVSPDGVPSSFDSQGLPEKVVTLVRTLPIESPLVFALTR